jgi:hypothetical protein
LGTTLPDGALPHPGEAKKGRTDPVARSISRDQKPLSGKKRLNFPICSDLPGNRPLKCIRIFVASNITVWHFILPSAIARPVAPVWPVAYNGAVLVLAATLRSTTAPLANHPGYHCRNGKLLQRSYLQEACPLTGRQARDFSYLRGRSSYSQAFACRASIYP